MLKKMSFIYRHCVQKNYFVSGKRHYELDKNTYQKYDYRTLSKPGYSSKKLVNAAYNGYMVYRPEKSGDQILLQKSTSSSEQEEPAL